MRPSAFALVPLFAASSASAATNWVRAPYLQELGSRQVSVLAESDGAHGAKLEIARGGDAGPTVTAETPSKDAIIELTASGLEPATTYSYTLTLDDGTVAKGGFTTAPEDDRALSFVIYGDNRTYAQIHAAVVKAILATPSDFLVHTGDMIADGSVPAQWTEFFSIERPLLSDRCVFPVIGNHEIGMPTSDGAQRYGRMFRVPAPAGSAERWYTFRFGSARFFMLDAQDDFASDELTWLEGALTAADTEPGLVHRFAVMHHGPYSSGLHGPNAAMRLARIPQLFKKHRVDLVISGHDHAYERGERDGLRYVVSGGGGAPLYKEFHPGEGALKFEPVHHFVKVELEKTRATMTVVRLDGSVIERCAFAPGGTTGWGCGAAPGPASSIPLTQPTTAPTSPLAPPAGGPAPSKACNCGVLGTRGEWLGLFAAAGLCVVAGLRRRRG